MRLERPSFSFMPPRLRDLWVGRRRAVATASIYGSGAIASRPLPHQAANRGALGDWFFVRWIRSLLGQWRFGAAALVAGAIIHILVTLSAADFSQTSAFRILSEEIAVNQVTFADPVTSQSQPLPFLSPDSLYTYCLFDASLAQIRVSVTLPDAGWSLSLHTPKGENFYYVPGIVSRETRIELVLDPPGNVFAHGATEVSEATQAIPVVKLPDVRGLVILRSPIKGLAYRRKVDEQRASFMCAPQDLN
ncbi:MAG: hypothetical protein KKB37_03400 [Alphaproteobacteria bacterium]|nr:hypothetical protein [Alphaproteobacteria bacterium]